MVSCLKMNGLDDLRGMFSMVASCRLTVTSPTVLGLTWVTASYIVLVEIVDHTATRCEHPHIGVFFESVTGFGHPTPQDQVEHVGQILPVDLQLGKRGFVLVLHDHSLLLFRAFG